MKEPRSLKSLLSFTTYCHTHPEERFWQALRNWSVYAFIYGSYGPTSDESLKDTFYEE